MMRPALTAIVLLLVLHVLAGAGLVGWLAATDRLSRDRVERVVEMFSMTLDEEEQARAEAERIAEQEQAEAAERAYIERVSDGPRTLTERLDAVQRTDELSQHRLERVQRETADLRRQIERAQDLLDQQRAELEADRQALQEAVERERLLREDADFAQAVDMYERLRPAQAKQMFQQLMQQGEMRQVVDYLAAMQPRQAGRVLQQFQDDEQEIGQATELIERLRRRGVEPLEALAGDREDNGT